jgi:predicted phosphodiesterase
MTTSHLLGSPSTSIAMADSPLVMRKTRFVSVSDTHNATPNGSFTLPKGDVLIHAGDMTNQGTLSELKKTIKWIEEADFEAKIVIAGEYPKSPARQRLTSERQP